MEYRTAASPIPGGAGTEGSPTARHRWLAHRMRLAQCRPCFLALAPDAKRRQDRYREFVQRGITDYELKFIRDAVQRNQLTSGEAFMLEIEQRTGERILFLSCGRPSSAS